jgi:hypothetical protein
VVQQLIAAINANLILSQFDIIDVDFAALAALPNPSPLAPLLPVASPSVTGEFITAQIVIVVLGQESAFDSTQQQSLKSGVESALQSGSTASITGISGTSAAHKFTTQANAVQVGMSVRAPASVYPNVNAIISRLQQVVRSQNGRLGGLQVVSISTVGSSSDGAAGRSAPAVVSLLAAVLIAVLSAMVQF